MGRGGSPVTDLSTVKGKAKKQVTYSDEDSDTEFVAQEKDNSSDESDVFERPQKKTKKAATNVTAKRKEGDLKKHLQKPMWSHSSSPPNKGKKMVPTGAPGCLEGLAFCITGVLDSLERQDCIDLIRSLGGRVVTAPSRTVSYAVVGIEAGESKLSKFKSLGTPVIDEDGLFDLIVKRTKESSAEDSVKLEKPHEKRKMTRKDVKPTFTAVEEKLPLEEMWTCKYAPRKLSEVCANPGVIKSLTDWLNNWKSGADHNSASKKGQSSKGKSVPSAVLLAGPPGIGKTTTAVLVCKELGYFPMEFNASDTRNRLTISSIVEAATSNSTLTGFCKDTQNPCKAAHQSVIIMDEVDGMSSGDRGGTQELIQLIKRTKVPIICICNDDSSVKVRSLANHCLKLKFRRPLPSQLRNRLVEICKKEGFQQVDVQTIERIVESCHGDMRQILNLLQGWRLQSMQLGYSDVLERLKQDGKTFEEQSIFELLKSIFSSSESLSRKTENYFMDSDLMPLMVQENYIICRAAEDLEKLSEAASVVAQGDIINRIIRGQQAWNLMPIQALLSGVYPGTLLQGPFSEMIHFPSWLGKNSTRSKNKRLSLELQMHMSEKISGSFTAFLLEYLPCLEILLSEPLIMNKETATHQIIERLDSYYLSKDDWDILMGLSFGQRGQTRLDKIPSAAKMALTRMYKSGGHHISTASAVHLHKVVEDVSGTEEDRVENETVSKEKVEEGNDDVLKEKEEEVEVFSSLVRERTQPSKTIKKKSSATERKNTKKPQKRTKKRKMEVE
eukprot:jgi/Galph1/3003/GphlegSOOS_G1673.1